MSILSRQTVSTTLMIINLLIGVSVLYGVWFGLKRDVEENTEFRGKMEELIPNLVTKSDLADISPFITSGGEFKIQTLRESITDVQEELKISSKYLMSVDRRLSNIEGKLEAQQK